MQNSKKGLTTIELMISVAILAMVMGASALSLSAFIANSHLDNRTDDLVQNLRKAQANSIMRVKDSSWGVYFDADNDAFTFFKGDSYASRDASYDALYELPALLDLKNVSLNGGVSEVVFEKVTGETDNYGSLEIYEKEPNTHVITINSLGQIDVT